MVGFQCTAWRRLFKFATGNWLKNNPIPASERRWGIANLVRDDNFENFVAFVSRQRTIRLHNPDRIHRRSVTSGRPEWIPSKSINSDQSRSRRNWG